MRKEREQQKLQEELTLEIFPSSSLTLHGTRGERLRERRAEEKGRRGQREERSSSILHLLAVSSSPSLKISIGCHIGSILSNLLPFSSLSPASSLLTFISFLSVLSSGYISHTFPLCFSSTLFPFLTWLSLTLPPPSCDWMSSTLLSSLLSPLYIVFCHPLLTSPSCDRFPSCITCPSPHPYSPFPCFSSSSFPYLHSMLTTLSASISSSSSLPCCCCPLPPLLLLLSPRSAALFHGPRAR